MTVTVDTTIYTADATWPSADGFIPAHIVFAEISEPVGGHVTADTTAYSADNTTWPTADGGILGGAEDVLDALVIASDTAVLAEAAAAADSLDAIVIAAEVPLGGGGYAPRPLRPYPVVGVGFGILPELEGEAHGVVVVAGTGVGVLPGLTGEATGTVAVTGRSAAQLVVRAAAIGSGGQVGAAVAVLKGLSVVSVGFVGIRGSGSGTIMKFEAAASGRHDDDEAAMMAFLLAA
jgi:hypothetical protein